MTTNGRQGQPDGLSAALTRAAAFHDHLCPRQVLGARIGLEAGRLLGVPVPQADKRLVTFVETDGCFADGLAAATGCWFGRRTLRLVDFGKVAATVVDTHTEQVIRLWPHPEARRRAIAAQPDIGDPWRAQLVGYQHLPVGDLVRVEAVTLAWSLAEVLSRPGQRVTCVSCGEEVINEREVWRGGQPFCRACAGSCYYRTARDDSAGAATVPSVVWAGDLVPCGRDRTRQAPSLAGLTL